MEIRVRVIMITLCSFFCLGQAARRSIMHHESIFLLAIIGAAPLLARFRNKDTADFCCFFVAMRDLLQRWIRIAKPISAGAAATVLFAIQTFATELMNAWMQAAGRG